MSINRWYTSLNSELLCALKTFFLCLSIVPIVPHFFSIHSHCFLQRFILTLCVWCLTDACFQCFVAAMLTFFKDWPAFHICAGQGVLFALTIMGDPQLLFRTLEEPLKCLCWCAVLYCTKKSAASGEVSYECISVRPPSSSGINSLTFFSFGGFRCPDHMYFLRENTSHCGVCVQQTYSSPKQTQVPYTQSTFMFSQTLHTQQEPVFLKHIWI